MYAYVRRCTAKLRTLIDQVGIVDRRQANLVPVSQNPTQLRPRRRNAPRHNQGLPSEIDEADLATVKEAPPPPKIRRPSQPTHASKLRRIEAKGRRSTTKQLRRKPEMD